MQYTLLANDIFRLLLCIGVRIIHATIIFVVLGVIKSIYKNDHC